MDEFIAELQKRFEQLELMVEGALSECSCMDGEAVLRTVDSLVRESELLESRRSVRSHMDAPNADLRIERYSSEFCELRAKKRDLQAKLAKLDRLDVPLVMVYVRENRKAICRDAMVKTCEALRKFGAVTKAEVDSVFVKSLTFSIRKTISDYICAFCE